MAKKIGIHIVFIVFFLACGRREKHTIFVQVPSEKSNIEFSNTIIEDDTINVINFQYCYNGGGVGVGDFNNDSLPDLFFTGNQVTSRLYINKGELVFEDVTMKVGTSTTSWVTGVSIVDINNDGWDDIYLSVGGSDCENDCNNLLFVNQGIDNQGLPRFEERALAYGLNDGNYAQQTVFFDYDKDGDLDAYIVHNGNIATDKNTPVPKHYMPEHLKDYLMRNDDSLGLGHPFFTNVSKVSGIDHQGFGLGIGINDFNDDGRVDIYVANDFITEDLVYLNTQKDSISIFQEIGKTYLGHQTYNAMGVDVSDVNNDALVDVLVLDMMPEDYHRQKKTIGVMNYNKYELSKRNEYASQYMRNTLQLGNGTISGELLNASEVGYFSNISGTDWSWSPLVQDYDNDGYKDIYVTNGYVKDITDLDFINYTQNNNLFGTELSRSKKLKQFVDAVPSIHLSNYIFKNIDGTNFKNVTSDWFESVPSFSNGAASVDLDADGDLDVVVNNINEKAFILENKSNEKPDNRYLQILLEGNSKNKYGIGAKIDLWSENTHQRHFQSVVRGYLSSLEPLAHFGLPSNQIDSIKVVWPSGKVSRIENCKSNQRIVVKESEAAFENPASNRQEYTFVSNEELLPYRHQENVSNDYVNQRLLIRQYSKSGPCLAVGDIDGEEGDELYIGASKGEAGFIWKLNGEGVYQKTQPIDSIYEDTDAQFVDVDGDQDLDLFIASGGNEAREGDSIYQNRLYLNDGSGKFTKAESRLPSDFESSSCIRMTDLDHDGDIDFFIGARLRPGKYPDNPTSKILISTEGKLTSVVPEVFNGLGMVTDALWEDIDSDGWNDLIVVGEWMPITIFKNNHGILERTSMKFFDSQNNMVRTEGWWNCIKAGDFDNDGDSDFLIGNHGLNGYVEANQSKPVHLYKKDFDANGSNDPILAQYFETFKGSQLMPVHSRDDIMLQLSSLKKDFLNYEQFSKVTFEKLLQINNLEEETLAAYLFESCFIENIGNGEFVVAPLPEACQMGPIQDILVDDFDNDTHLDALLVGNDFTAESNYGRYDALTGIFLRGLSENKFEAVPSRKSGFYVVGDTRKIAKFSGLGEEYIISLPNNSTSVVYEMKEKKGK